jgi:hypothetical protein
MCQLAYAHRPTDHMMRGNVSLACNGRLDGVSTRWPHGAHVCSASPSPDDSLQNVGSSPYLRRRNNQNFLPCYSYACSLMISECQGLWHSSHISVRLSQQPAVLRIECPVHKKRSVRNIGCAQCCCVADRRLVWVTPVQNSRQYSNGLQRPS